MPTLRFLVAQTTEIAQYLGIRESPATVSMYADGEINIQVQENIRGKGASSFSAEFLSLSRWVCHGLRM